MKISLTLGALHFFLPDRRLVQWVVEHLAMLRINDLKIMKSRRALYIQQSIAFPYCRNPLHDASIS